MRDYIDTAWHAMWFARTSRNFVHFLARGIAIVECRYLAAHIVDFQKAEDDSDATTKHRSNPNGIQGPVLRDLGKSAAQGYFHPAQVNGRLYPTPSAQFQNDAMPVP